MSPLIKSATTALIAMTVSSLAGHAGAAPLGAPLALRDAATPAFETVWWRGGSYAYDYDYYCPPGYGYGYYAPRTYGYYAPSYYGGYGYGSYYRGYAYAPRVYGRYWSGY